MGSVFEFVLGDGVGVVGTSASFGSYFRTERAVVLVLNAWGEM